MLAQHTNQLQSEIHRNLIRILKRKVESRYLAVPSHDERLLSG